MSARKDWESRLAALPAEKRAEFSRRTRGELPKEKLAAAVRAHLKSCLDCRAEDSVIGRTLDALRRAAPPAASVDASILEVVDDLESQLDALGATLTKLRDVFGRSAEHVSKGSSELLEAIRLFSR